MVMSSQLHASAALTLVKSPSVGYAVDRSLSETQSPLEAKRKMPLMGVEDATGGPVCSLSVSIPVSGC